jgi:hypothetical protein
MSQLRASVMLLMLGCVFASTVPAMGQRYSVPSYQPATSTLSPWFNLYQRNTGPLDNYHMYVRPQLQLQSTLQRQDANIQLLGQAVAQPLEQKSAAAPTGTGSGFMSYSHYYPSLSPTGRIIEGIGGNRRVQPRASATYQPVMTMGSYSGIAR